MEKPIQSPTAWSRAKNKVQPGGFLCTKFSRLLTGNVEGTHSHNHTTSISALAKCLQSSLSLDTHPAPPCPCPDASCIQLTASCQVVFFLTGSPPCELLNLGSLILRHVHHTTARRSSCRGKQPHE